MGYELVILEGPQAGRRLPVEALPMNLGRSSSAQFSFPNDNFISGNHLSVQTDGQGVLLTDLHSTNGTFLNGERIATAVARPGDTIKIGSMILQVATVSDSPAAPVLSSESRPGPGAAVLGGAPSGATTILQAFTLPTLVGLEAALPPMEIPEPPPLPAFAEPPAAAPVVVPDPPTPAPVFEPFQAAPAPVSAFDFSPPPPFPAPPAPVPEPFQPVPAAELAADFMVPPIIPPPPVPEPAAKPKQPHDVVLQVLKEAPAPLFCLLNASADDSIHSILALADLSGGMHCLLESGPSGLPPQWAPFLLKVSPDGPLLRLLVSKGWGQGWVSLFTSPASLDDLTQHFRKFLAIQMQNGGEPYFRFWEPSVLRGFMAAGKPNELTMFFGPAEEWYLEGENGSSMLRVRNGIGGAETANVNLV